MKMKVKKVNNIMALIISSHFNFKLHVYLRTPLKCLIKNKVILYMDKTVQFI